MKKEISTIPHEESNIPTELNPELRKPYGMLKLQFKIMIVKKLCMQEKTGRQIKEMKK